ncbi:MAG: gamma-glutamyl-gamma-aminobutyrate hydrolase family protein, partial [Oscillospiraceae bacterium]
DLISERHRHKYEVNTEYREELEKGGLKIAGTSPDNKLIEAIENPKNKWFVAVQYHPEFKSRPNRPHPLFKDFVRASVENK